MVVSECLKEAMWTLVVSLAMVALLTVTSALTRAKHRRIQALQALVSIRDDDYTTLWLCHVENSNHSLHDSYIYHFRSERISCELVFLATLSLDLVRKFGNHIPHPYIPVNP